AGPVDFWLMQLVNGASYGMLLFLVAVGLSLILGLMGYVNMAHGAFVALGGYVGLAIAKSTGSFWLAILVGALVAGLVCAVLERVLLFRFKTHLTQVLGTFGIILIIIDATLIAWGGVPETMRMPAGLGQFVTILDARLPVYRLVLIVVGVLAFVALWWFQERTRYGAVVRAGLDDPQMVEAIGIN